MADAAKDAGIKYAETLPLALASVLIPGVLIAWGLVLAREIAYRLTKCAGVWEHGP